METGLTSLTEPGEGDSWGTNAILLIACVSHSVLCQTPQR